MKPPLERLSTYGNLARKLPDVFFIVFILLQIWSSYRQSRIAELLEKRIDEQEKRSKERQELAAPVYYSCWESLREILKPLEAKRYDEATTMLRNEIENFEFRLKSMDDKYLNPEYWEGQVQKKIEELDRKIQDLEEEIL